MQIAPPVSSPSAGPSRLGPASRDRRRQLLVATCRRLHPGCDAILVCDPKDIQYLTGVPEGISWLIVSGRATVVVTRHMLVREVRERLPECEVLLPSANSTDRPDVEGFVASELRRRSLGQVLIETAKLTAASYLSFAEHCAKQGVVLSNVSRIMAGLRAIKNDEELQAILHCVEIAENSLRQLISGGAAGLIGKSERQVAVELERIMIDLGADRQGFPGTGIIIASGPNSAEPHHRPGSRRIEPGDPLLVDWGAERSDYRSDLTRTCFIRQVPEFAAAAYPVVEAALNRAASLLGPGQLLGAVDGAARQTVIAAGFPEFYYGVGHGVGLDIHEEPWIRANSAEQFETGMVTTIEPGIYLPGIGGIRIEKLFRILPNGAVSLGSLGTSLDEMTLR